MDDPLRFLRRDFEQEIKDRWPNGITPAATPLMKRVKEIHMAKKPAKPSKPMKPSKGGKKGC